MSKPYVTERNLVRAEALRQAQLSKYSVDNATGCWVWGGGTGNDGYGKIKRFGKTLRAHRVFYEHHKGPIPAGLVVMHLCDRPLCVNPDHLVCGTHLDNERDKDRKGRRSVSPSVSHPDKLPRGESHYLYGKPMPEHVKRALLAANVGRKLSTSQKENRSPLTASEVLLIARESGTQAEIALKYRVTRSTIGRILRGERWGHVTGIGVTTEGKDPCEDT